MVERRPHCKMIGPCKNGEAIFTDILLSPPYLYYTVTCLSCILAYNNLVICGYVSLFTTDVLLEDKQS